MENGTFVFACGEGVTPADIYACINAYPGGVGGERPERAAPVRTECRNPYARAEKVNPHKAFWRVRAREVHVAVYVHALNVRVGCPCDTDARAKQPGTSSRTCRPTYMFMIV